MMNLAYEKAVETADDDGYAFPTATTAELQHILELLTANDVDEDLVQLDEVELEESEIIYDWEELEAE